MCVLCIVFHLVTIVIIFITLLMWLQVQQYSCHVIISIVIFMSCDHKYSNIHVSL